MDLSDNNDDLDSFFATKKTKNPTGNPQKSTKFSDPIEDLFGIDEPKEARQTATRRQVNLAPKANANKSFLTNEPVDDVDDDDLGFDPKKPKSSLNKTQNLLDDLLAPLETKRPQTAGLPQTKPPAISRQSTDTTTDTSNQMAHTPARPKTSQGRRSSNMSSSVQNPDPLGLFGKDKEPGSQTSLQASTPKSKKRGTTADWLGLTVEAEPQIDPEPLKAKQISETTKHQKSTKSEVVEVLHLPETVDHQEEQSDVVFISDVPQKVDINASQISYTTDSTAHNIMVMNTLNQEAKQSFNALKYQEQQVLVASQMKQQEKVLMEMRRKQESLLQHQERQFQNLLQQQMQRHQQLEEHIKQQQQRINNHLHLMMSQPPLIQSEEEISDLDGSQDYATEKTVNQNYKTQSSEREKQSTLKLIQLEADNKRLELENLRLEELVANTKSNYEKEIELLEKSYKKQIEVLDNHLNSLESRLKSELEEIQSHFQAKIATLEQEKQNLKKSYEEDFSNLKQDHEDEFRKQRKNHEEDLEMLKEEHRRMLDNIRQSKMLEFAVVQENGSYLENLKIASNNLSDLTGGLQELKKDMQTKIDLHQLEKEKKLEAKEKRLDDAEKRLKITEESNETEKKRLLELISTLELQMAKMSKDTAEENWQLRQKLVSLDAEKSAFAKEREFCREQLLRDEERIKDLKELQLMETQRLQAQIEEERTQLQVDISKFELEKRLHSNTDMQKEKMEVEAAMQVAQDAARKADMERERYFKMQRQLEQQKRDMVDKEHSLAAKEEEVHQEILSYRMAQRVSQDALAKAKLTEQFYHNKLQMFQQRAQEIAEKESSLSQERLLLAQDRIALHALQKKLTQETKCSLCQLTQKNKEFTNSINANVAQIDSALGKLPSSTGDGAQIGMFDYATHGNLVDRLLDANIADSLRKMQSSTNIVGWETLLDDDHKKMVQNHKVNDNREEFK